MRNTHAGAIARNRKAARIVLAAALHIALADDGAARLIFSRALDALANERRRLAGKRGSR